MLVKTLTIMAAATSVAVASVPQVQRRDWWGADKGGNRWWNRPNDGSTVTVTGFSPEPTGWGEDSAPSAAPVAPVTTTTAAVVVTATPAAANNNNWGGNNGNWGGNTNQPAASPSADSWAQPEAAPSSAPVAPSSGGSYMDTVNQLRSAGGLPALTHDSSLEANSLKTCNDAHGSLTHELNPGSFAQVLAPGDMSDFYSIYVGGWLCEVPSLKGLNGICATESAGWDHSDGETGHADILTSTKYTKIGCAASGGICGCDLA